MTGFKEFTVVPVLEDFGMKAERSCESLAQTLGLEIE